MNKKLIFIAAIAVTSALAVKAQTTETPADLSIDQIDSVFLVTENSTKANAYKTTWQKNKFKDTWFLSVAGGAQILMGEDDDKGPFKDRLTFAPSFAFGKYFSPIWGLRISLTGGSLHGYNDGVAGTYRKWNSGSKNYVPQYITWDPTWVTRGFAPAEGVTVDQDASSQIAWNPVNSSYHWNPGNESFANGNGPNDVLYMQHVRYAAVNLNFLFDALTLFGDYNPKRAFDITLFGGPSVFHTFANMGDIAYTSFGVNAGIQTKFRLSNKFNAFAEFNLTAYPDDFDGHAGDNAVTDLVGQAQAGLTYKIGKSTWEVCEPTDFAKIDKLNQAINELKTQYIDLQSNPPVRPCPPVDTIGIINEYNKSKDQENKSTTFLPDPVFFRIDKSIIDAAEWEKIQKAADYLNRNPYANVVVTGYADRQTAYPAYNLKLSERRAKVVAQALTERYNISPSRISINWAGDYIQPFKINDWNRVVIFVIEK